MTATNPTGAAAAANSAAVAGSAAVTATEGGVTAAPAGASGDNPRSDRRGNRINRRYESAIPTHDLCRKCYTGRIESKVSPKGFSVILVKLDNLVQSLCPR